jgi:hypothetical protein
VKVPGPHPQLTGSTGLSPFRLAVLGCLAALVATLAGVAMVLLAPAVTFDAGYSATDTVGSVRTRQQGEEMERKTMEALARAKAYAMSDESKRASASRFRTGYFTVGVMLFLLGTLVLIRRSLPATVSFGLPLLVVSLLVLLA